MDGKSSGEGGEVPKTEKSCSSNNMDGVIKLNAPAGSISSKNMIFRADKVDLKSLDLQLEKHLSRVWSRNIESQNNSSTPRELWEIDPSKLEIRYLVAQGTYGTVYRGTYNSQDVAGIYKTLAQTFTNYRKIYINIASLVYHYVACYLMSSCLSAHLICSGQRCYVIRLVA